MKEEKYKKLRNMIKDDQVDELNDCMKALNTSLTKKKRIQHDNLNTKKKLHGLPDSSVTTAAIDTYTLLKGATKPENVKQLVITNALNNGGYQFFFFVWF